MDADERKPAETPVGFAAAAVSFDDPEVQVEGAFLGCQEHIVRKTTRMKARQASPALPREKKENTHTHKEASLGRGIERNFEVEGQEVFARDESGKGSTGAGLRSSKVVDLRSIARLRDLLPPEYGFSAGRSERKS